MSHRPLKKIDRMGWGLRAARRCRVLRRLLRPGDRVRNMVALAHQLGSVSMVQDRMLTLYWCSCHRLDRLRIVFYSCSGRVRGSRSEIRSRRKF